MLSWTQSIALITCRTSLCILATFASSIPQTKLFPSYFSHINLVLTSDRCFFLRLFFPIARPLSSLFCFPFVLSLSSASAQLHKEQVLRRWRWAPATLLSLISTIVYPGFSFGFSLFHFASLSLIRFLAVQIISFSICFSIFGRNIISFSVFPLCCTMSGLSLSVQPPQPLIFLSDHSSAPVL